VRHEVLRLLTEGEKSGDGFLSNPPLDIHGLLKQPFPLAPCFATGHIQGVIELLKEARPVTVVRTRKYYRTAESAPDETRLIEITPLVARSLQLCDGAIRWKTSRPGPDRFLIARKRYAVMRRAAC
jgi:hypothetical protein